MKDKDYSMERLVYDGPQGTSLIESIPMKIQFSWRQLISFLAFCFSITGEHCSSVLHAHLCLFCLSMFNLLIVRSSLLFQSLVHSCFPVVLLFLSYFPFNVFFLLSSLVSATDAYRKYGDKVTSS